MIDTIQRLYTAGNLVPSVTEFNNITMIQYDIEDQHIKFELARDEVFDHEVIRGITQHVNGWKKW